MEPSVEDLTGKAQSTLTKKSPRKINGKVLKWRPRSESCRHNDIVKAKLIITHLSFPSPRWKKVSELILIVEQLLRDLIKFSFFAC